MATKNKKEIVNTEAKNLVNLVIKEIGNENFDFGVVQKMQQAFSTASKQKQREAFISFLDKKLNKEQLHKLNQAIMENANEFMPDNDPNFVCRTPNNKVFQEILLLEAKRSGMKAKFNAKGELQSLDIKDITQEILDHYRILQEKFYPKRDPKDLVDSRIAQSVNFLLYTPLFQGGIRDIYKIRFKMC
ncbi:MAG: Type I site-specific deoxyribonuclease [Rickettsia helvetica]|uniref:Type I site-specific deoxyribonuclease n=1 Tax=Rickettsia helvetica TaxID=35789 RepID=A0ABM9NCG3_RICHE